MTKPLPFTQKNLIAVYKARALLEKHRRAEGRLRDRLSDIINGSMNSAYCEAHPECEGCALDQVCQFIYDEKEDD